jgi:hypothetical protein
MSYRQNQVSIVSYSIIFLQNAGWINITWMPSEVKFGSLFNFTTCRVQNSKLQSILLVLAIQKSGKQHCSNAREQNVVSKKVHTARLRRVEQENSVGLIVVSRNNS